MAVAPLAMFLIASLLTFGMPLHALKVGFPLQGQCSTQCESRFCLVPDPALVPLTPLFRYGKYCGFLYQGCNGETPCDELDKCCMRHDECITDNFLDLVCNTEMLECVKEFKRSCAPTFEGNTCDINQATNSLISVMEYFISLVT